MKKNTGKTDLHSWYYPSISFEHHYTIKFDFWNDFNIQFLLILVLPDLISKMIEVNVFFLYIVNRKHCLCYRKTLRFDFLYSSVVCMHCFAFQVHTQFFFYKQPKILVRTWSCLILKRKFVLKVLNFWRENWNLYNKQ